jgi:type VII secretion protein EccB
VADDRDAIDSLAFRRRQLFLAFTRGSKNVGEALVKRPNRPLYAGVAVALVVCLVVGVKALVDQGPPKDWDADGTLVIDRDAGGRYLTVDGTLRPVLNLTSLRLLSGGALPRSVQVGHGLLAGRPVGQPIGIAGAPDQPPALVGPPARWVACQGGRDRVDLLIGLPPDAGQAGPGAPGGVLARASDGSGRGRVYLVTGPSAFPLSSSGVLARLGYSADQVRAVPRRWLDLLPKASPLELQPLPGGGGIPGAPFMADGTVVVDQSSGVQYLAAGGELHRVLNRTSLLLLDHPVRGPAQVPGDAVAAQPLGEPFGLADAPASPPQVPDGASPLVACVSSDRQPTQVLARPPVTAGLVRARPPSGATEGPEPGVRVWLPPGRGVLARPSTAAGADPGTAPAVPGYLVAEGVAYPVADESTLGALGYRRQQVQPLPRPWLGTLPTGPPLRTLRSPGGLGG